MKLCGAFYEPNRSTHRPRSFWAMLVGVAPGLYDLLTSSLLIAGSMVLTEDGLLPILRERLPR